MKDKEDNIYPEEDDGQCVHFSIKVNKDGTKDLVFPDSLVSENINSPDWEETVKTTKIYKEHQESIDWVIKELKDNPNFPLPKEKINKPFFYASDVASAVTKKDAFYTTSLSVMLSFLLFSSVTLLNAPSNNSGLLPCILGLIWSLWLALKWTSAVTTYKNWESLHNSL